METTSRGPALGDVEAQAFVTPAGHKLLLANKRDHAVDVMLPSADSAHALTLDEPTPDQPACSVTPVDGKIRLGSFAVMVVSWSL